MPEAIGSGGVLLEGSASHLVAIGRSLESSWSILGTFESEFLSEWSVGEGEYYWYRVTGVCGQSRCDTTGVVHNECNTMTFMTMVGARNLSELCYTLANPVINSKVDFKLSSIQKYSKPINRIDGADPCNSLEDQEFCHIAECLDYCIDQDVKDYISFSAKAIEAYSVVEMSGGISIYGQVQTDRNKYYEPQFPIINILGASDFLLGLRYTPDSSGLLLSGTSENTSTSYVLDSQVPLILGGFAQTVSPSRGYSEMAGGIGIQGGAKINYAPNIGGGLIASGSSESFLAMRFNSIVGIDLSGGILDYISPTFSFAGTGSMATQGSAQFNFNQLGIYQTNFGLDLKAFDFNSESSNPLYGSTLTISDFTINPSCGCGPVPLAISLKHNLSNSTVLSAFLRRSGISIGESFTLRYRKEDSSWRSVSNFVGKGRDGVSSENLSIIIGLSCDSGFWEFSFSAKTFNMSTGDELKTKFILDIPADVVCSDGSISAAIEADIKSGDFSASSGLSIPAVSPSRISSSNYRRVDFFVDGIFNDKRVYYDDIGLFKNRYWSQKPLRMTINTPSANQMQKIEVYRIFPDQ